MHKRRTEEFVSTEVEIVGFNHIFTIHSSNFVID